MACRNGTATGLMLIHVAAVVACVQVGVVGPLAVAGPPAVAAQQSAGPAASAPGAQPPARGRGPQPVDAHVQIRTHHFAVTNEDIPQALFVSSKVKKDKKAPLIVTPHGIGETHTTMMRPNAIDLAEAGGHIPLAPMGYNDYLNYSSRTLFKRFDVTGVKIATSLRGTLNVRTDTDSGWSLEAMIPWPNFEELSPRPPVGGTMWKVNFNRWDGVEPNRRMSIWSDPQNNDSWPHVPSRFGQIVCVD